MTLPQKNKKMIKENRRKIFELEALVNANKLKVFSAKSAVEQNYNSIMRNYNSAFMGNHNLTAQNTDEIFRNRVAILSNMDVDGETEINFRESMTNEANIDFLEIQAGINKMVLKVNLKLAEINGMLIELNKSIMEANESSVSFNTENLKVNERFLNGEFHPSKSTPKDNQERAIRNGKRCKAIESLANENQERIDDLAEKARKNSIDVLMNSAEIASRRERINENQKIIIQNQLNVAKMISKS